MPLLEYASDSEAEAESNDGAGPAAPSTEDKVSQPRLPEADQKSSPTQPHGGAEPTAPSSPDTSAKDADQKSSPKLPGRGGAEPTGTEVSRVRSFDEIVDLYIAQASASGGGPPPGYKSEILEIYASAPPHGQEQMRADMEQMLSQQPEADESPGSAQPELECRSQSDSLPGANVPMTFSKVVDLYIAQAAAGGDGPPPEYKAQILEIYENAPPDGQEQMLADMQKLLKKDEEETPRSKQLIQGSHVTDVDESLPFSKVVDLYIAQAAADGDGPPPEYKDQILEIYENAPPEGQEQMVADMRDLVNKQAREQAQKAGDDDPHAEARAAARQEAERRAQMVAEQKAAMIARLSTTAPPPDKDNPMVFFEIAVEGDSIGRIEFELFADVVPKTAENFRCLCTGEKGRSQLSKARLSFRDCVFHRIIPGFMCQGGDFTEGDGTGGESIYGEKFDDENFKRKHRKGCLSMANSGKNTNGSQFFICTEVTSHLDNKHVVFGEVKTGYEVVQKMEALGSRSGRTLKKVSILDCGEVDAEEAQALKRPRVVDFAPAPRIQPVEEACLPTDGGAGGLFALLQERDEHEEARALGGATEPCLDEAEGEPEEVHVLHILRKHTGSRKPKNRGGQPITCSQKEAQEYLEWLARELHGISNASDRRARFAELAKEESECASGRKGGDYGRFTRGKREQAFEEAAFTLKTGELSKVVSTASGEHIILRVP